METMHFKKQNPGLIKLSILSLLLFLFQTIYAACPIQSPNFTASVNGNTVSLTLAGGGYNSYLCGYGDATYGTQLTHTYNSAGTKTICVRFYFTDSVNTSNSCDTTICKTITIVNTTPFVCPIREPNFTTSLNGYTITLTKIGSGYNSYLWTYGDGSSGTSNTHTYTSTGPKTICLKYNYVDSTNSANHCDTTICKTITVTPNICPIQSPNFTTSVNGNTVSITLAGGGYNSYLCGYGDATYGTQLTHSYNSAGTKTICIKFQFTDSLNTSRNCDTTICKTITIQSTTFTCPISQIYFYGTVNGSTVTLTNIGSGYTSYQWNYGDGTTGTSNTHTYTTPGVKTICLKYSYVDSSNTARHCDTTYCKVFTIASTAVCPIREANFTASVNGNTVTLTKVGVGYNAYLWNYGDGTTGTSNTHTYTSSGTKTICLNFRYIDSNNTSGSCDTTVCKTITIVSTAFNCPIRDIYFYGQINGNTVTLTKIGSGYTSYQWNYGDGTTGTSNTHTYTTAGVKTICLKYSYVDSTNTNRHCDTSYCKTFTIATPAFTCHLQSVNFTTSVRNDTVYLTKTGGGYTSYIWSYGDGQYGRDNFHVYNSNGTKTICIKFTDSTSAGVCDTIICKTITITGACDSVSCVLPGDADHDFTVNNFDIFAIGLSYNRTGPVRPNATTQYTLQPAPDWATNSYYVFNDKFSDCNGNGVINNGDGSVILQNYIAKPYNQFNHRIGNVDSLPPVSLAFDTLPVFQIGNPCNTAEIVSDINVGSQNQMAQNVFGIGFSVNYPANFSADSCFRIQVDLDANSWFANNEPVLYLVKNLPQFNRVDIGISRTTGTTRSGNGKIGRIKFVVEDGIFINGRVSNNRQYTFKVENVAGVDNRGNNISFVGLESTASFVVSGIKQNKVEGLKIYPNPTNSILYINARENIETVRIIDLSGRTINEISADRDNVELNFSDTENGMYIIEIKGKNSVSYEKIFKQ